MVCVMDVGSAPGPRRKMWRLPCWARPHAGLTTAAHTRLAHDADGEDGHGSGDGAHAEEREEADAGREVRGGLHGVRGAEARQPLRVPERKHEPEQLSHQEERSGPFERLVPRVVDHEHAARLLRFRDVGELLFDLER
jgi:hypothetical protein